MDYTFNYQSGRVLDEFQMIYITKGGGTFESASCKNVTIGEGIVFFLFPGEWHRFKPEQLTGWDSYWVGFKGKFAENLVANGYLSVNKPVVKVGYNEEIVSLYQRILEAGNEERQVISNIYPESLFTCLDIFITGRKTTITRTNRSYRKLTRHGY